MPIDASLFAHIHNDAFLTGTVKLQGNFFKNTITYLNNYCDLLTNVPDSYTKLIKNLSYLQDVEQNMRKFKVDTDVKLLAAKIANDVLNITPNTNILIPGGWSNAEGGHAMVYQFSPGPDGYVFTVFNTGSGLGYHSKKSIQDKELYNPQKMWTIPIPKTTKEKKELELFISRLLQAKVRATPNNPKIEANEKVLYEEILPSISYIQGKEINADKGMPDHAYTGGQISGTCSQRCIHQMLKINSDSQKTYQQFIFNFKMHSLNEYVGDCLKGTQPFNKAVVDQINLAIYNSLKIINIPGLFTPDEVKLHQGELRKIKEKVANALAKDSSLINEPIDPIPKLIINEKSIHHSPKQIDSYSISEKPNIFKDNSSLEILERLHSTCSAVQKEKDPALQYVYLKQLILSLPLNKDGTFTAEIYKSLLQLKDYQKFLEYMNNLQKQLTLLQGNWTKKAQIPLLNHLKLSVLSLQIDAYEAINSCSRMKKGIKGFPSFAEFGNEIMGALITKKHDCDPFEATNNAYADQRICFLKERFPFVRCKFLYLDYYLDILKTEPELNTKLTQLYEKKFGLDYTPLHEEIRTFKAESFYMIMLHLQSPILDEKFNILIDKIKRHYDHESRIREAINPFYDRPLDSKAPLKFNDEAEIISLKYIFCTPLNLTNLLYGDRATNMPEGKYNLGDSPAGKALEKNKITRKANTIQLKSKKTQGITAEDIADRDYYHLRGNPGMQISLTLDYFTQHMSKLRDADNQRYVEANLFQPGLLADALTQEGFISQFDSYLKRGTRFFAKEGQNTPDSLQFFRLDLLVSRYYAQLNPKEGAKRLQTVQEDLAKQLLLSSDPKVLYGLNQYLFLATMARIEAEKPSMELLEQVIQSYFYIKMHANPLFEDPSDRIEMEEVIARYKLFVSQQSELRVEESVKKTLLALGISAEQGFKGTFPNYSIFMNEAHTFKVDVLRGLIFEDELLKTGVPFAIQHHPLIKQLGLQEVNTCLANPQGTYFVLQIPEGNVYLYYENNKLTVHKDWTIDGKTARYELQGLTPQHEASYANGSSVLNADLPSVLTDRAMNYWKNTHSADKEKGILVRNNIPLYVCGHNKIKPLSNDPLKKSCSLISLKSLERQLFNAIESNQFIIAYGDVKNTFVELPRYGLHFHKNKNTKKFINEATGEELVDAVSPIHPSVAGLVLEGKGQRRVLIPKMRFYGLEEGVVSDFYPVVHDKNNLIAEYTLKKKWEKQPPAKKPMWDYQGSEDYVSFQIVNGEPFADTPADALYLAYTYLVTNQPEKAWKTLEECTKRLGGLKGDPAELRYIQWICTNLPFLIHKNEDPLRGTPPFVACQLKAMSLLTDYLLQDGTFEMPSLDRSKIDANSEFAQYASEETRNFLIKLPESVYTYFEKYQTMGRYLDHRYQLSKIERKRLLDYYHQSLPKESKPLGALGYQWTLLSLEAIKEEEKFLRAQKTAKILSPAEKKRLAQIEKQLAQLQAVQAVSTELDLVKIDLSLPIEFKIKEGVLKKIKSENVKSRLMNPKGNLGDENLQQAIELLSSAVSDDDFIENFYYYLFIAGTQDNKELRKLLMDFCTHTLIAQRHLPFNLQTSNIPYLCNVLYRVAHSPNWFSILDYSKIEKVIKKVSKFDVPPLEVYQAKDVYSNVLATREELIAEYEEQVHQAIQTTILPPQPLIVQMGIEAELSAQKQLNCNVLRSTYQTIQNTLNQKLNELGKKPSHGFEEEFALEEEAGALLITAERERQALAQDLLNDSSLVQALTTAADKASTRLQVESEKLWNEALTLAQKGPKDTHLAQTWAIELEAQSRAHLTQADLRSLYTKADLTYTIAKTGLSPEQAQTLHDTIHKALVASICLQSAKKVKTKLQEAVSENNLSSALIALDLLARPEIPALDTPPIVLLQHEEQILLHNRQVSALKELLTSDPDGRGFKEVVEKIIMGGGKSKVILPILAEMKAQGGNLTIVEVPQALLETNHEDLNRTSQRLYGKRAYRFDFHRDSKATPKRLKQIYSMFVEIMTNKHYLVTTGEAMESLELKYIELLEAKEPVDQVLEQQLYWLDKIMSLVRHHGDCIIDEVHQGLSIKKRLNYTCGPLQPVKVDAIRNVLALFKLIDSQFINEAPFLSPNYDWTPFKQDLAKKLLADTNSPLYFFVERAIQKYGIGIKDELVSYLTNQAKIPCLAVEEASAEEQETLGFFKQEVGVLLQQTLVRKLKENYGPSKRKNLIALERTLALPYLANNVVNERSRFGNQLESLNYTVQMMLIRGISQKLLVEKIKQWQLKARNELFQNSKLKHFDETPTAKEFAILAEKLGLKLSQVNLNDAEQLKNMHAHFQHHPTLTFEILQNQTLGQIQREGETISSNAFNHVDLYRSVQAVSGTPSNHSTFHQRLSYNKASSLGTDSYIIETIRGKQTAIKGYEYTQAASFIEDILTDPATLGTANPRASEFTRAIIDINATFEGVSNFAVAQELARFYQKTKNKTIKHILYFDKNQVLCALDVAKPDQPILLKTTDEKEINRILGSTPNERFTYYDQSHTVGTDISQDKKARGVVLVDEKTSLESLLQGSMRMRGLSSEQTLEIVVPRSLKDIKLEALVQQFVKNDCMALANDNLTAVKLQMSNLIRTQCLSIIRDLNSEEIAQKRQLAQIFKSFLVDKPSDNFYELYGALNKKQATQDILKRHKEQLESRWKTCLASAKTIFPLLDPEPVDTQLQTIIDKALPNCLKEYDFAQTNPFGLEVQIQMETQIETQQEVAIIHESFDSKLEEEPEIELDNMEKNSMDKYSISLNTLCSLNVPNDLFSEQLRASKNYARVYKGQTHYVNSFLKPALVTWYYMHEEQLGAMIITTQEAEKLIKTFESGALKNSWFVTNLGTVIGGKRPEGMLNNKKYLALQEQVRFFNGDIPTLLDQPTLYWLKERNQEKLEFFRKELMAFRPESSATFPQLKTLLSQENNEGYLYITRHRFQDLSHFDWKDIVPKVLSVQAAEYTQAAAAFAYINQHWDKETLDINKLEEQFHLSSMALSYVQEHLDFMTQLKNIINHLAESKGSNTFLNKLTPKEKEFLEEYLNISLQEFITRYTPALDLNALLLLRMHPALKGTPKEEQLTQLIVQDPACTEATVSRLINSSAQFNDFSWHFIIKKPWTSAETESITKTILGAKKITPPQFIIDSVWNQFNKDKEGLINFAKLTRSTPLFNKIFVDGKVDKPVQKCLLKNPAFSSKKLLAYFLEHHADHVDGLAPVLNYFEFAAPTLKGCVAKAKTSKHLLDIVSQKHANAAVFVEVTAHQEFSLPILKNILKKSTEDLQLYKALTRTIAKHLETKDPEQSEWEKQLIFIGEGYKKINQMNLFSIALSEMKLSKKMQFNLLTRFGNEVIDSYTSMFSECTDREIKDLLKLNLNYTNAQMQEFVNKAVTTAQVTYLLNRPEMTSSMADAVFTNPSYDNKIKNWSWLTKQQLLDTLNKTTDFNSLKIALTHPNLSKSARNEWLKTFEKRQDKALNSQKKVWKEVDSLKILACKHIVTGIKRSAYTKAAKAAFELYQTLHQETTTCFSQANPDLKVYQDNCKKAIQKASPVLATHRGYKQKLLDILNVILAYVTFNPPRKGIKWRFFEVETASMKQVGKVQHKIEKWVK
jgi:hypothetical protein